jgi:trehalose 6-phosphate phosphatase
MSLEDFFAGFERAVDLVLMLDYDGTLAPFQEKRGDAIPYPGVRERLEKLVESEETRLIIISGRRARDLDPLLGLDRLPEIWGCHGAERLLPDESYQLLPLSRKVVDGLEEIDDWAEKENLTTYLEKKPAGRAFHWRGLDESLRDRIDAKVRTVWTDRASACGLALHVFDGGIELRAAGINKGGAVAMILEEIPEHASVAYLGDDHTDEDAFRALAGKGLRVLVRPELRETIADLWVKPPVELLEFLDRWTESASAAAPDGR